MLKRKLSCFILEKNKTRAGGSFFPYLNSTIFDLPKHGMFKSVDRKIINIIVYILLYKQVDYHILNYKEFLLTLRNRHIHKCGLSNLCNTLETNIELNSTRNDGKKSDVDHYPQSPHIEYDGTYNLGLVKGSYFIHEYTELTSYSLDNPEELKHSKDCNKIWKLNDKYKRGNDRFVKALQLLKMMMDNVDTLITPIELTDEALNTILL